MTRPFFTRERISDFDIYNKNCASALQHAKIRLAEGYPVEFQVNYFLMNVLYFLKALFCVVGSSCSVHLGLCHKVLIWQWCWIIVSGYSLSTISGTSKQTFILQPSLYHICQGIQRKPNYLPWTYALWQRLASVWIFSDKVTPLRKIIDDFTEPLMEDAIAKRKFKLSEKGTNYNAKDDESDNLLAHLVKHTQGMQFQLSFFSRSLNVFLGRPLDKNILKDEVI